MEIKVNVPKGFKVVYRWVDGDLVITIEREVVATTDSPKAAKGGLRYYKRGIFRAAPGLAKGKVETRKDGGVVIHVVTDKQPTISQSGTGSTGPRKPHA